MPLPTGMCMECGGVEALDKTCVGGRGFCKVAGGVLEGVPTVEGSATRVPGRRRKGFQR